MVTLPPRLDPRTPLIICDADEVLVQFAAGLEAFLERRGHLLDLSSFRIHGNVRRMPDGTAASDEEVSAFLQEFFISETRHLRPVAGAAEALAGLRAKAQIVVLSNLPEDCREARAANLKGHGMDYPVIAGRGPKGEAVRALVEGLEAPAVFIDDLPPHIASVAREAPRVQRLHFVADPRLARLIPKAADAHARIDAWPDAAAWIADAIRGGR